MTVSWDGLYAALPVPLQNLAITLAGARLHRRRYGGDCSAQAASLRESQWLSAEELQRLQREAWVGMARNVLPRVPYYRRLLKAQRLDPGAIRSLDDLQRFPFLEKETVRDNPRAFLPDGLNPRRLFASSTSGSTGTPLTLYTDLAVERRYYSYYLRLMEWMGVGMGEPRATFFGRNITPVSQVKPPFWRHDWSENNWQFSSFHLAPAYLVAYLDKLEAIRPVEIRGYASSLVQVARALVAAGRVGRVRPRVVHTTAETLLPGWKQELEQAFQAPVFDMYGSSEMSHFVSHCQEGRYHVHAEFGILEILQDDQPVGPGEEGDVVCTSFVNTTQPLVRYRIGDRAIRGETGCPCGRNFPTLAAIQGRTDDYVITPDGRQIGRLDPVFKGASHITECQIIQDRNDRLVLKLVPAAGYEPADALMIVRELRLRVGNSMEILTEVVDTIPKGPNGKFRAVMRLAGGNLPRNSE